MKNVDCSYPVHRQPECSPARETVNVTEFKNVRKQKYRRIKHSTTGRTVPSARGTLQGSTNATWPVVLDVDHMPLEATAMARASDAPLGFNCRLSESLEC
jgi:hypothetical protein